MAAQARDHAAVVEATVVTASGETVYRRAGHGRAVLLLDAPPGLFARLTAPPRGARETEAWLVVEPIRVEPIRVETGPRPTGPARADPPGRVPYGPGTPGWRQWLEELVDGLGVERPVVVVGSGLAGVVRSLAAEDPDRFGPVVDAVPDALARAGLPVGQREH